MCPTPSITLAIETSHDFNSIRISFEPACPEEAWLKIYDEYGQAVYRTRISFHAGFNEKEISLAELPDGTYYLDFRTFSSGIFQLIKAEKKI